MGQRAGDTCGGRPRWAGLLVAAALVLAGCAGDGGDGDGSAAEAPADSGSPTTATTEGPEPGGSSIASTTTEPTTTTTTTLPEGSVAVPLDEELVERLPRLSVGEPEIATDAAFDERLCTGEKGPAVPKGQARAAYDISPTEHITVAAYRFADDDGALYLASYVESVRSCARAAGPVESLPVPDAFGSAFSLATERGEAYVVAVLTKDVLWVMFIETTEPPLTIASDTIDTFVLAVSD